MADFTNIDGVYAKDIELRSGIDTLRTTVLSNTIKPLTVTKNGTYTAIPSSGTYGYSPITVDVQEEPWEPLQDGYSNFWFELTNDTLSPWLNFSAKEANAVIDWGDGSGEVALDTLTPTHTYAKAGRYIVKCKGVTGIGRQHNPPYDSVYFQMLKCVELNAEVDVLSANAFHLCMALEQVSIANTNITYNNYNFSYCSSLKRIICESPMSNLPAGAFQYAMSLQSINLSDTITAINSQSFLNCMSMKEVTIPSAVTTISTSVFQNCSVLSKIHMQPTTPPTLGSSNFLGMPSNYIIYVPVGTGDTYKAASGWSTYADHIVEEGQSLSMAALRRIQAEKNDNGEEMR